MDCLHPVHLKDQSGPVPCGRCEACLTRKRDEWCFRLKQEHLHSKSSFFFTLTYQDDNVPLGEDEAGTIIPSVDKRDVQLFLKRLRKNFEKVCKFRYFVVSEYSPNDRPHYHGLIFFPDAEVDLKLFRYYLQKSWTAGFVTCDGVLDNRIYYVAKYLFGKSPGSETLVPVFMLSSRRPGIGASYLTEQNFERHKRSLKTDVYFDGKYKMPLPEYYKRKVFSDEERQQLHINNIIRHKDKEIEYQKKYGLYDQKLFEALSRKLADSDDPDPSLFRLAKPMSEQVKETYIRQFYKKNKSNKLKF